MNRSERVLALPADNPTKPFAAWLDRSSYVSFALLLVWYCLDFVRRLSLTHPEFAATLEVDRASITGLAILILGLTLWSARRPPIWASLAVGGLVGALFYFRQFGWAWLDPGQIDWLMNGDLAQHYLGWAQFRQEGWQWPPGAIEGIRHPVGTSVFFTDSMPLFALALKPFGSVLPTPFQYIGLLYLLNWVLMGVITAATLRLTSDRLLVQALAALLLVLSPVLLVRIGHDSLTSQWLLVAAIGLVLWRNQRQSAQQPRLVPWLGLVVLAAFTHLYLLAMVLALLTADWLQAALHDRVWSTGHACRWMSGIAAAVVACLWIAGAFAIPGWSAMDRDNAGRWSADLLSLFNPDWSSRWIPGMPGSTPEQWEGWAYLGTGAWLAVLLGAITFIVVPATRSVLRRSGPLWAAGLLLLLFSLGPTLTLAGRVLLESEILKGVLPYAVFRACGRFIWVLHYLLLVSALLVVARAGRWPAVACIGLACALQIADSRVPDTFAARRVQASTFQEQRLGDRRWSELTTDRRHIELVPAAACGPEVIDWLPITELAVRTGLTINSGHVARIDGARWHEYCLNQVHDIDQGMRRTDTIYVVHSDWLQRFLQYIEPSIDCQLLDELHVCVVTRT